MSVTALWYGSALSNAFGSLTSGNSPNIDWLSDDIRVALVTSAYTPNQDTHDFWNDVVANEAAGTGYTANGQTLANAALTYTAGTNVLKFDGDDTTWASSTVTARYAVMYDRTPATDATRPLIMYVDFGSDQTSNNGNFTISWSANGTMTVTIS